MKPKHYRTQEVNLDNFDFASAATDNRGGKGKSVNVKYKSDPGALKPFYLQTPKMFNAWGLDVSQSKDANGNPEGDPKYYVRLSFGSRNDSTPKNTKAKFHSLMHGMDGELKKACVANSLKWFKEKPESLTEDVLNNLVNTQVKQSLGEDMEPDGQYPDNVRFRIPFSNETQTFPNYVEVYDENGVRVKTDTVEEMSQVVMKKCKIVAIVMLSGVYIAGGKVGYNWRIRHMQVFPPADALSGFAIQDEEDEYTGGEDEESV